MVDRHRAMSPHGVRPNVNCVEPCCRPTLAELSPGSEASMNFPAATAPATNISTGAQGEISLGVETVLSTSTVGSKSLPPGFLGAKKRLSKNQPLGPGRPPCDPETPHNRSSGRSNKTAADKRREMREKVLARTALAQQIEENEEKHPKSEAIALKRNAATAEAKADPAAVKTESFPPSAQLAALRSARLVDNSKGIQYPDGITPPKLPSEPLLPATKLKYDRDFLMQFQPVVTENPAPLWDRSILDVFGVDTSHLLDIPGHPSSLGYPKANAHGKKAAKNLTATKAVEVSFPVDAQPMLPPVLDAAERANTQIQEPSALEKDGLNEKRRMKPRPLNPQIQPTGSPQPATQHVALRSAKSVANLKTLRYPEGIVSPNPALNAAAAATKYRYDRDFLMKFQKIFTEMPCSGRGGRFQVTFTGIKPNPARKSDGLAFRSLPSRGGSMLAGGGSLGSFGGPPGKGEAASMSPTERFRRSTHSSQPWQPASRLASLPPKGKFPSQQAEQNAAGTYENPHSSQCQRSLSNCRGCRDTMATGSPALDAAPRAVAIGVDGLMSPVMVQRRVKAALNKMTPETFDKFSNQIVEITGQSKHETDGRTLRQVVQLIYGNAVDDGRRASLYAKLCSHMQETMDPSVKDENVQDKNGNFARGPNLFRKYLLNRCEEQFVRDCTVSLPGDAKVADEELAWASDPRITAALRRRRRLGLIQFVGELYGEGMVTQRVIRKCVLQLDFEAYPEHETVEGLCTFLRTIGAKLDSSEKSRALMDTFVGRIKVLMGRQDVSNRMRFMLMVNKLFHS